MSDAPDANRLDESDVEATPLATFRRWYAAARDAGESEPDAMCLATVGDTGLPSNRFVLLKTVDERGFVFYTNYRSRKAADLDARPVAALAWRWARLERQVRAVGWVTPVAPEESDAYFATRARRSQLAAWASPQSEVLAGRSELEARLAQAEARFAGGDVPRPPWWGGLCLAPSTVEFWQGRANRLHDRLRYRRADEGEQRAGEGEPRAWIIERLAP